VLHLSRLGLSALSERGLLTDYPDLGLPTLARRSRVSEFTLSHELEVMDVKAAIYSVVKSERAFSITEFTTWPLLCKFEVRHGAGKIDSVRPDGFFRIHRETLDGLGNENSFFLEVDRSTEKYDTLVSRAVCYLDYYQSGAFAERNGAERSQFRSYPFRVLMVLKSEERRNNIVEQLLRLDPPILSQVWLSTLEEVKRSPFGSIWIRPIDYRDAVKGTEHDVHRARPPWAYRRQTARDSFIRDTVTKYRILGESITSALSSFQNASTLLTGENNLVHSGFAVPTNL
jgi:hypothetical protein